MSGTDSILSRIGGALGIDRTPRQRSIATHVETYLHFVERGYSVDGVLIDVSRAGGHFRPGLVHILRRTGDEIMIEFGQLQVQGKIVHTNKAGYGIVFNRTLTDAELRTIFSLQTQPR